MFLSTETMRAYDLWLKAAENDFKERVNWVVAQVQRSIEKKVATIQFVVAANKNDENQEHEDVLRVEDVYFFDEKGNLISGDLDTTQICEWFQDAVVFIAAANYTTIRVEDL